MFKRRKNRSFIVRSQPPEARQDPATFLNLISQINHKGIYRINETVLNDWKAVLKESFSSWDEGIQSGMYKALSKLLLICYETELEGILSLLDMIDQDETIHAKTYPTANPQSLPFQALRFFPPERSASCFRDLAKIPNAPPSDFFYWLYFEYESLKDREQVAVFHGTQPPEEIRHEEYLTLIETFKRQAGKRLAALVSEDVRIASKLAQIYFDEYNRRNVSHRRELLKAAISWAEYGASDTAKEPIACGILTKSKKLKRRTSQKCLKVLEEHPKTQKPLGSLHLKPPSSLPPPTPPPVDYLLSPQGSALGDSDVSIVISQASDL